VFAKLDLSSKHFMHLPGLIAFFFYPNSLIFLFAMIFVIAISASFLEIGIYKLLGGNLIVCSLFSEIVVFRLANFGYVPQQSYFLFGAILINVLIIFCLNKFLFVRS
jgi:hypothetical protein